MALRDKLIARRQTFLPPNTQVRHVFQCSSGPTPYDWITGLMALAQNDYLIVAVSADQIFVLQANSWWPTVPTGLRASLPRDHLFNLVEDTVLGGTITLMGDTYQVRFRFWSDVQACDAELKPDQADADNTMPVAEAQRNVFHRAWSDEY